MATSAMLQKSKLSTEVYANSSKGRKLALQKPMRNKKDERQKSTLSKQLLYDYNNIKYNIKANINIYSAIKHSGIVLSSGCLLSLD